MKKVVISLSVLLNILVISGVVYVLMFSSMSANVENVNDYSAEIHKNSDSLNKTNNLKLLEISPLELKRTIESTSKLKKTVVVFWASWCSYCPNLIKIMKKLEKDKDFDFSLILVSIDKPNEKGRTALLKKSAQLHLTDSIFIGSVNKILDISNSKAIYDYLPENSNFDQNPGFPHIIIFENQKIVFEDSGFDERYGISKFISLLVK